MRTAAMTCIVLYLTVMSVLKTRAAQLSPKGQEALEKFADPKTADSGTMDTRAAARETLIAEGAAAVPALDNLLQNSESFAVRLNALIALTKIAEKEPDAVEVVTERLSALLAAPAYPVRYWAVKLAGWSRHENSVPKLLEMLQAETDSAMLEELLLALGNSGSREALKPLTQVLRGTSDGHLRACAADALGMMKNPEAVAALLSGIEDSDPRVSNACAQALTAITGCSLTLRPDDTPTQVEQKISRWQECWDAKQK